MYTYLYFTSISNPAPCGSLDWRLHDRPLHILRFGVPREGAAVQQADHWGICRSPPEIFEHVSDYTLSKQLQVCPKRVCISTVGVRKDLYRRDPHKVPITDFFGAIRPTRVSTDRINVTLANEE